LKKKFFLHVCVFLLLRKWVTASWDYFSGLAMSPDAKESGQTLVPGYVLSDNKELVEVSIRTRTLCSNACNSKGRAVAVTLLR
jgi:hypothetical protein